jgi:hypothetical protein
MNLPSPLIAAILGFVLAAFAASMLNAYAKRYTLGELAPIYSLGQEQQDAAR